MLASKLFQVGLMNYDQPSPKLSQLVLKVMSAKSAKRIERWVVVSAKSGQILGRRVINQREE